MLEIDGPIGPAISDYFVRGLAKAGAVDAGLVILRVNTPGGLDNSMRDMVQAILASPIPVAVWVAPGGARAASAGTYILYASHFAVMAPATNLGAATPVPIGPGMTPPADEGRSPADKDTDGNAGDDKEPVSPQKTMGRKVLNDAVAYIRSLAELRGRNAEWAEEAVRKGASLSAEEALANNVIDAIAENLDDLLTKLDGRTITIRDAELTLDTKDWEIETLLPDWRWWLFLGCYS